MNCCGLDGRNELPHTPWEERGDEGDDGVEDFYDDRGSGPIRPVGSKGAAARDWSPDSMKAGDDNCCARQPRYRHHNTGYNEIMQVKAARPIGRRPGYGASSSCGSEDSAAIRKSWLPGDPLPADSEIGSQHGKGQNETPRPDVLKTDREWARWGAGGMGNTPPAARCHGSLPVGGPPKLPKPMFSGWEPGEKGLVNLVKVLEEEEDRERKGLPRSSRRDSYRKNRPDEY